MDIRTVGRGDGRFDWDADGVGLATDGGLETAVILSLFTDARAGADDGLPPGEDPRGWWGDAFSDLPGDGVGSRLWLLQRAALTAETVTRARAYALEALQWLVDDGLASQVEVSAQRLGVDALALEILIHRPDGAAARWRFDLSWGS